MTKDQSKKGQKNGEKIAERTHSQEGKWWLMAVGQNCAINIFFQRFDESSWHYMQTIKMGNFCQGLLGRKWILSNKWHSKHLQRICSLTEAIQSKTRLKKHTKIFPIHDEMINQSINQSINQGMKDWPINQSINRIHRSINQSIKRWIKHRMHNQSINQTINQSWICLYFTVLEAAPINSVK